MRPNRPLTLLVAGLVWLALVPRARAGGPADALFPLVPPDAGATVAVEDLSGLARECFASPLAGGLRRLPAVQRWLDSDQFRGYQHAKGQIERLLGENIAAVRDRLLGDAVVLTLRLPAGRPPDQARGLLLVRVRDRELLGRLVEGVNAAQLKSGELARVNGREHRGVAYSAREFRGGAKPPEYYATLAGGIFAFSNSEELILGVIDRQLGRAAGLDAEPAFRGVRKKLPGGAAVSLYVDPRFIERVAAGSPPREHKPGEERLNAMLARYLGAVRYAGASVRWRDGIVLETHETIDPDRLDPWLRRLAGRPDKADPRLRRIPPSALAMVTAHADPAALLEGLRTLVPDQDQPKLDNLLLAAGGMMLGQDVRSAVLPNLGPALTAYLDRPGEGEAADRFARVVEVSVGGDPGVPAALDNGLRTLLAFSALDDKRNGGRSRVESRTIAGVRVTALSEATPLAYAVADGRLALGSSPSAVARAMRAAAGEADNRIEPLRAEFFPDAETFACADLGGLHRFVSEHREAFAHRIAERRGRPDDPGAARDLDQVLALFGLFRAAFAATTMAPDGASVHRTAGLIARDRAPAPRP